MRIHALFVITMSLLGQSVGAQVCDYEILKVSSGGLVANLFLPKAEEKVPVVIAIGGSEGGIATGNSNGEMMAPHCIAVLGLAYFKEKGLPNTLDHIPLEYFIQAIDYLETIPKIDSGKIGIVGGSRGAEVALLLASMEPRIKSVVATTPSSVAWYGRNTASSAWTFKGKDIPALSLELDEQAPVLSRFQAALNDQENVKQAFFSFEKIRGPIFLVSAENDQFWPSYRMAKDLETYLKERDFRYAVVHKSYPTGHGFSAVTAPEIKHAIIDHFIRTLRH